MKDLAELFFQARKKKIYKDIFEFRKMIKRIEQIDNGLEWLVTKDAVDDERMSLLDLYFATV